MGFIGDLCDIQGKVKFEWKIKDFLQLSYDADTFYESPEFSFCGTWKIRIYPNGHTYYGTVGWVDLFIVPTSSTAPITVDCSLQVKTVDGKVDPYTGFKDTYVVEGSRRCLGSEKFISRTELTECKSELLPSGILTVICTLEKSDPDGVAGVWKLQEQLKEILVNGTVSDIFLKVDGEGFKSHRCILAARSPVFKAMLTHDTKEKNTGFVDIQDIESSTFSTFLNFLYTGSKEIITLDNVVKLYAVADKYQVDDLKKSCLDYMLKNISVDSFCDILNLSLVHAEENLTDACTKFFIEKTVAIVSTPKWVTFLKENPAAENYTKELQKNMKIGLNIK